MVTTSQITAGDAKLVSDNYRQWPDSLSASFSGFLG